MAKSESRAKSTTSKTKAGALVSDLMTRPVLTCRTDERADSAARIMWNHDCGVVPVVDHEGRLAGMVTDRDLCMASLFHNAPLSHIELGRVMSRDVATCTPATALAAVQQLMRERQVRRIPIVNEHGHPIGIVALGDLARPLLKPVATRKTPASGDTGLAQTVAAISQPHHQATGEAIDAAVRS